MSYGHLWPPVEAPPPPPPPPDPVAAVEKMTGARPTNARALGGERCFELDRADFPRVDAPTWRTLFRLRGQMLSRAYCLDENVVNRNLRILAELLDDAARGVRP